MSIVNDFRCTGCGLIEERWTPRPAPAEVVCSSCGASAVRLLAAVGLGGRAKAPAAPQRSAPRRSLCSQYPMVPGLCHMSESAGRMWVAKYQGDNRTVERELAKQEERATVASPTMADAITHNHHPEPVATLA